MLLTIATNTHSTKYKTSQTTHARFNSFKDSLAHQNVITRSSFINQQKQMHHMKLKSSYPSYPAFTIASSYGLSVRLITSYKNRGIWNAFTKVGWFNGPTKNQSVLFLISILNLHFDMFKLCYYFLCIPLIYKCFNFYPTYILVKNLFI